MEAEEGSTHSLRGDSAKAMTSPGEEKEISTREGDLLGIWAKKVPERLSDFIVARGLNSVARDSARSRRTRHSLTRSSKATG